MTDGERPLTVLAPWRARILESFVAAAVRTHVCSCRARAMGAIRRRRRSGCVTQLRRLCRAKNS